jgi:flagellar motor switch protein FliG
MLKGEVMPRDFSSTSNSARAGGQGNGRPPQIDHLSLPQRAAIILVSMGPDYAAPIAEKLSDAHLRKFVEALKQLHEVPREAMLAVVADFVVKINGRKNTMMAGPERALEMAEKVLDSDRLKRLSASTMPKTSLGPQSDVWGALAEKPVEQIIEFLLKQKIEISAFIISKLPTGLAGEILSSVPDETSVAYVKILSENREVAPFAQRAIEKLVRKNCLEVAEVSTNDAAIDYTAELLSMVSKDKRDKLLQDLENSDEERAKAIRKGMLTFEDLPVRLPTSAIQIIFKDFPKDDLLLALQAGGTESAESVEFLMANISQRMAERMKEEIEALPEQTPAESDKAINNFMSFVTSLHRSEKIVLVKAPVEDDAA